MKSPQNNKKSVPLLLHSFGIVENPLSSYNSRVKHNTKVMQVNSPPASSDCQSNLRLACNTSRKNLQTEDRSIQEHYQNMEKILINENANLKQQNAFLTAEVRKCIKREAKVKEDKKHLIAEMKKYESEISDMENEIFSIKNQIESQLLYISRGLKTSSIQQIKNIIMRHIDSLCGYFQLETAKFISNRDEPNSMEKPQQEEQSKSEIDHEIEILTRKLQRLLDGEHSPTKGPQIRRQCIEISKQIKQLKEKSRTVSPNITQQINESLPYYLPKSKPQSSKSIPKQTQSLLRPPQDSKTNRQQQSNRGSLQGPNKYVRRKSLNREVKSPQESPNFYNTSQSRFK